jgi:hypothetical protein
MDLITIEIDEIKAGMQIIVDTNPYGIANLARHTVSHTSLGHPGKKTIYCKHGFIFYENSKVFLDNKINKTFLLLEGKLDIEDYNE